ncbi:uncharacterized protein LOC143900158 [Temnothorax americanus]|uniref:uncharacterized protein LOC143899399 n=1 Tax=Temnothorax americanus TaxID=1964332 RepID=UPI004068ABAB
MGDFYTPDYCQRWCTSLREQYNREKRRLENQCRSVEIAIIMSDHDNYCNNFIYDIGWSSDDHTDHTQDIGSISDDSENVVIAEKSGDEFLIELYRERSFLYDKRNANFKNTLMKQNAWNEISKTMIETNCGDFYTPDYCQRRCTSLREQYNREKKRLENQCRSGSGAPNLTSRQFPLYAQLKFLDQVIKRRKTYSNVTKCQPDATFVNKGPSGSKSHVPDDVNAFSSCNKESQNTKPKEIVDAEHTYGKGVICSPRPRKRKLDETKELEHNFFNVGNRIVNYMESTKASTADDAFMEFIKVQFNGMPEHKKHIRRKMMMDCLITPLPETSN